MIMKQEKLKENFSKLVTKYCEVEDYMYVVYVCSMQYVSKCVANISKLCDNLERICSWYYIHSDISDKFKYSTTNYCVTNIKGLINVINIANHVSSELNAETNLIVEKNKTLRSKMKNPRHVSF